MVFAKSSTVFIAVVKGITWVTSSATYTRLQLRTVVSMNDAWPIVRDDGNEKRKYDGGGDSEYATKTIEFKKPRMRKKMHALLMAYCGQGYLGLQRNVGSKTIEEELMNALKKLEIVNEEEFVKQQLINFQRAARTDKGVSAIRQVLSLSMSKRRSMILFSNIIERAYRATKKSYVARVCMLKRVMSVMYIFYKYLYNFLFIEEGVTADDINRHLPEQIRVLAVKRVTKGFNSKNSCDARTYSYTCPSFAFAPQSVRPCEAYRINDYIMRNLNAYTGYFIGTHNFHNYTSGRKPFDPSCQRHILEAEWKKPIIRDGLELITFIVKGQSFMLHQIRKMVGTLMSVCRGYVEPNFIQKFFSPTECAQLPVAPALGLLLEQVHYDWYNKKYGSNGIHEKLDFVDVEHLVQQFRETHIYPVIMKEEKEGHSMLMYLDTLHLHYNDYHIEQKCSEPALKGDKMSEESVTDLADDDKDAITKESMNG